VLIAGVADDATDVTLSVTLLFVNVTVAEFFVASLVLSTFHNQTIVDVIPATVPVKVGLAIFALKFNAVCCAVDTGFPASVVLSTFHNQTSHFTIPVGVFITGEVKVLFVSVCVAVKPTSC